MNLVFFGIQGSGKGTQAKLLAQDLGYTVFETGGELRRLAQENSELGQKVKSIIESGHLVSAELVMEILEDFVKNNSEEKIIFDGIPRNSEQANMFNALLADHNIDAIAVHFTLNENEALSRLMKRAEIEGRADDNEESIKRRISIFYADTTPVIDLYRNTDKLIEVDASDKIETVYENLIKSIDAYRENHKK